MFLNSYLDYLLLQSFLWIKIRRPLFFQITPGHSSSGSRSYQPLPAECNCAAVSHDKSIALQPAEGHSPHYISGTDTAFPIHSCSFQWFIYSMIHSTYSVNIWIEEKKKKGVKPTCGMNYTYTKPSIYSYRYSRLFFGRRSIYKLIRPEKLSVSKLEKKRNNAREIQPGIFQSYVNLTLLLCTSSWACPEHFCLKSRGFWKK